MAYKKKVKGKGVEDFVNYFIQKYYKWKEGKRPTIDEIEEEINNLNSEYLEVMEEREFKDYNSYFMDSIQFLTGNANNRKKEVEADKQREEWNKSL